MRIESHASRVVVHAPAKLNLFLEVLRKREDGFHELDTVMVETDLCDRLTLEPADRLTLECPGSTLSPGEDNLVMRAARLLAESTRPGAGARMVLEKRVPMGAGLGGGSADAAAALAGLSALWFGAGGGPNRPAAPARDELSALASRLGSDISFFLWGGACRCTGRGEIVAPVPARPLHAVLVYPGIHVPTPAVYRGGRIDLSGPRRDAGECLRALAGGDPEEIGRTLFNRLEGVVFAEFPAVARAAETLAGSGALAVRMSGSGSAVFALTRGPDHAAALADAARSAGLGEAHAVRTATGRA